MKKRTGNVFVLIGILLVTAALVITVYNIFDEKRAGSESGRALEEIREQQEEDKDTVINEEREAEMIPDYILDPEMEMPVLTVDGTDYIGTISIPAIDRELPVISRWSYPNLRIAPCRYEGSAYLDNLIIAAHNYDSHFGQIKNLGYGDRVIFTDAENHEFVYEVADIETLGGTAVEEMSAGEWDLTLFTCTIGGQTRVTVRCRRLRS